MAGKKIIVENMADLERAYDLGLLSEEDWQEGVDGLFGYTSWPGFIWVDVDKQDKIPAYENVQASGSGAKWRERFLAQEFHYRGRHDQETHGAWAGRERGVKVAEKPGGGATLRYSGNRARKGIAVGGLVKSRIVPASEWSKRGKAELKSFITEHRELLKRKDVALGLWHDPESGNVFIDASELVPETELNKAKRLGRKRNEIGIYRLSRGGKYIPTGGTGGLN